MWLTLVWDACFQVTVALFAENNHTAVSLFPVMTFRPQMMSCHRLPFPALGAVTLTYPGVSGSSGHPSLSPAC